MRQFYFLSIAILFAGCSESNSNAKKVIHDTVFVEKKTDGQDENTLIGTTATVLTLSEKIVHTGHATGLWLESLTASECGAPMEHPTPTQITSIKQPNDSILVIKALIDANCSHDFLGEAEVLNGNTLNLIYHGYGGYAQCNCEFELTYTFKLSEESSSKPDQIKYVTMDGVAKTPFPKIR
jgi:hypothetical protein